MEDNYRTLIAGFLAGVLGWLEPIAGDVFTLIYIFVLNFFFGYLADRIANGNDFNLKKAWRCLTEAALFFLLVASIYGIGKMKQQPDAAIQCVSTVAYIVIYFYSTNILRNLMQVLKPHTPAFRAVDFLYYILSFEIIRKIPLLGEYLNSKKEEEK
ncbi:MAG: phage holin family protein [Bacteroidaceae bacterium]|nr:phage holin family protein [Bacteroidaceae bacterium]